MKMLREARVIAVGNVVFIIKDSFIEVAYAVHGGGEESECHMCD
jgi:hypothetical protein